MTRQDLNNSVKETFMYIPRDDKPISNFIRRMGDEKL